MSELKFNPNPDEREEFLDKIQDIEGKLYRPGIESKFPPKDLKKFKEYRGKWSHYVETVRINILADLVERLKQNETAFEIGIEAINREIQEINDTVSFLNLFERTIGTLGRIITLPM